MFQCLAFIILTTMKGPHLCTLLDVIHPFEYHKLVRIYVAHPNIGVLISFTNPLSSFIVEINLTLTYHSHPIFDWPWGLLVHKLTISFSIFIFCWYCLFFLFLVMKKSYLSQIIFFKLNWLHQISETVSLIITLITLVLIKLYTHT